MSDTNTGITGAASAMPWHYRLAKEEDPFFVVNKVGRHGERESGQLVFNVDIGNGLQRHVCLRDTWIPQDISDQALPSQIKNSLDFRQLVNKGVIEPISPEAADALFKKDSRALNELKRQQHASQERSSGRGSRLDGNNGATVMDQRDLARREAMQNDPRNPKVFDNELPTLDRRSQPGAGAPTNLGVEVIDRFRKGDITLEQACDSMRGVGTLLNEEQKNKLRTINNVPDELIAAIASIP